ncbi:MAG: hypothetical protein JST39_09085 [Bacteroidetes bacterium]|nr:hypothetical protein [Bacteroidota bacterium]
MSQLIERLKAPTPVFFRKLRNIGLALSGVATTIATAPLPLPALAVKIAGYLAVAGGIASVVSQSAVEGE